ncbi:hypothetical protein ACH9D2_07120 [Kocuria sp. M4R2S49]|uniref:hypothetical protein n=1 Tax=Kocuria rhizosphaericola TaxID=3376284 RepID=UPI0037B3BBA7
MGEAILRGKVAALLNEREAAINLGNEDGVEVGDRFAILASELIPVTDPDTEMSLGEVEYPKAIVKVVRVTGPHLSIVRTFRTIRGRPSVLGTSFSATPDRVETLNVDSQDTLKSNIKDELLLVRRGDPVVLATGDAYLSD